MNNNKSTPILSKEDSLKLMQELISKGIVKRAELLRHGVRLCTIIEYWKDEVAYQNINKAALDKLDRDIERREAAQSVQDYYFKKAI